MKNKTLTIKITGIILSIALAGIDQLTKLLAVEYIKPYGTISLLKFGDTEWLNLTYCENTGMSFSLLEGQRLFLIAVPILLICGVEWYIFSGKAKRNDIIIALSALAGGGLGNLIDRIWQGYVVDFIDFRIINFAIFNFADICAVCGGFYFGITLIIEEYREEKAKKANADSDNNDTPAAPSEEAPDEQA